jgi:hypothetical protein
MNNTLLNIPNIEELKAFVKESSPLKGVSLSAHYDKFIVHKIAKMLPTGSVAVEIGTYLGGSAALMAHANPQLEVHSYDLFDDHKYDPDHDNLVATALGPNASRSLENVAKFLSQYTNIHLHKVNPLEQISFEKKIDMFIEDASHRNPQLHDSLSYWLPKINVNGFALLHDYRPWLPMDDRDRFIDVENHVENLSKNSNWNYLGNFSCFAIFQRIKE